MSIHFEQAIEIARSPEDVFETINDFSQTPVWLTTCTGIEKLTPGPNAVGTKLRYGHRDSAHSSVMEGRITALVPNERLSFEYADDSVSVTADFRLSPSATGTTLVHRIEVTPQTFIVSLMSPLIRSQLPKQTSAALEALRHALESSHSAAGALAGR